MTLSDIVKGFVVDEFKYNPVLENGCDLATEEFFQEQKAELKVVHFGKTDVLKCEKHKKRFRFKKSERRIYSVGDLFTVYTDDSAIVEEDSLRQEYSVLFHGTDIKSAVDISSGGIDVSMGSQKRDFSDGSGFYLTDDFEHAENWAFSMTQKPVVLIFKIPNSCLENVNILSLSGEERQWKEIVDANRSGILDREMRKTLKDYDGIEGPVSGCYETDSLVDSRQALPNTYQLCITNEDFADKISEYLSTIVVYNRI
ncbi:uncharacterized protein LOC110253136 isoform X2 [Exaiptasia diaphana]|uniref:DUF3990 domain-containing protein n=1 Tax=Exaiptasia diaphana TaxID=2652724 RepID=A0A913YUL1_EXADI|nr:uncharacterized protein LOC110253136 isoform X2 [Exaiptasia diaphana]